jgi:periodic tryptophan protein 1
VIPTSLFPVWSEEDDNLYVHHDIMLASFPLCVEWLDFDPSADAAGNLVAVGTMEPEVRACKDG